MGPSRVRATSPTGIQRAVYSESPWQTTSPVLGSPITGEMLDVRQLEASIINNGHPPPPVWNDEINLAKKDEGSGGCNRANAFMENFGHSSDNEIQDFGVFDDKLVGQEYLLDFSVGSPSEPNKSPPRHAAVTNYCKVINKLEDKNDKLTKLNAELTKELKAKREANMEANFKKMAAEIDAKKYIDICENQSIEIRELKHQRDVSCI